MSRRQLQSRCKEQNVHDHVELCAEVGEKPIERIDRRHQDKGEAREADKQSLRNEQPDGNMMLVLLGEKGGQKSIFCRLQQAFSGRNEPIDHSAYAADDDEHG